jgi:uncharacterized protein
MRVLVTGGTGFLGRPLVAHLAGLGYDCTVLTRNPERGARRGFPSSVKIAPSDRALPPADVVIHLAGESIVGLWTARKRGAILASRVEGTRRLIAALRASAVRPHTLLAASAVGIYGDRPGETLDETSSPDPAMRFRAVVCREWESAANGAADLGLRVVNLRIGNVLDPSGGYLGGLLPVYRLLGGVQLGNPQAAISWVAREDAVRLITFALANDRWFGPLNVTAPAPATQQEFAAELALALNRRVITRIPPRLLETTLGEFSRALLDDQRVLPAKASAAGFAFVHPRLQKCLTALFTPDG